MKNNNNKLKKTKVKKIRWWSCIVGTYTWASIEGEDNNVKKMHYNKNAFQQKVYTKQEDVETHSLHKTKRQ